ncbi:MAG: hypothetical protein NW205_05535 [Hyphomicrobiaceae bacterium]|nr:hypothetical protein [Hyphomicrobiaceae bacterium]
MTPPRPFRLIDSGVADGRRHIAYDAALIELHAAGEAPDTVRLLRFPPTVLVGRHQVLAREVHVERCRAEGVGLVRRLTGGGAIYLDEGQVGWELVFGRKSLGLDTLGDYAQAISEAVAGGLSEAFAIRARFRPRNDIEVDGRKISGTSGYFEGDTLVYQGTVLVDFDAARMARLLNTPAEKLARHAANAESRVVSLSELIGAAPSLERVHDAILDGLRRHLGIATEPAQASAAEIALTDHLLASEIGTDDFVVDAGGGLATAGPEPILEATRRCPGGTITAYVRLEGAPGSRHIREVSITGDFFISPPRALYDLEARLRGAPASAAGAVVEASFATAAIGMLSLTAADFAAVLRAAIDRDGATP